MTTDNVIYSYPITKGELLYIYSTIKELQHNLTFEAGQDTDLEDRYIESLNIIDKILEFKEEDTLEGS